MPGRQTLTADRSNHSTGISQQIIERSGSGTGGRVPEGMLRVGIYPEGTTSNGRQLSAPIVHGFL